MYRYKAHVTEVYDGDTITVDIELGFGVMLKGQKIRLFGIDTPEIRGGNDKVAATSARDVLRDLILNHDITIDTARDKHNVDKKGKYGRWLGTIYISEMEKSVNDFLVESNLARRAEY